MGHILQNKDNKAENAEKKSFADCSEADILALKGVSEMKKILLGVIAAFFVLFGGKMNAFGAVSDNLEYSIIGGEAVITGFKGEPTELDIPEFISCYPVTEVRDNAFCYFRSLKRISLPSTLTKLGHHCFYACDSLESIALPEGLAEIGEGCFCGCGGLANAELPDSVDVLPDSCFRACTSLKEIKLPSSLKTVGAFCFAGCTSLEKAETDEALLSVGERAFFMCDKLSDIYIPPACTSIGAQALGYTCEGNMELKQRTMVIGGCAGSAAESYAADNGLRFSVTEKTSYSNSESSLLLAAFMGVTLLLILIVYVLKIVFTDWSDQKLK